MRSPQGEKPLEYTQFIDVVQLLLLLRSQKHRCLEFSVWYRLARPRGQALFLPHFSAKEADRSFPS